MACLVDLYGLKPKLCISLSDSTIGSSIRFSKYCKALSCIVDMPKGLNFPLDLGIHTRLIGFATYLDKDLIYVSSHSTSSIKRV